MISPAVLFWVFLVIFTATAIITLLGVVGVLKIRRGHLNSLLGAFLLQLAVAIIALFSQTPFFVEPEPRSLAASLGAAYSAFDEISDEIEATIYDRQIEPKRPHHFLVLRFGDYVAAYNLMKIISGDDLASLPSDQKELIETYEKSMSELVTEWKQLKAESGAQLLPENRAKRLALLCEAKSDLVGILDILQSVGIYLDDHYLGIRGLVWKLNCDD